YRRNGAGVLLSRLTQLVSGALLAVMVFAASPVDALTVEKGRAFAVGEGDALEDDLLFLGQRANIGGQVVGDAALFVNYVAVDGSISGALIAGASDVTINGRVDGSVIAMCGLFSLEGSVGGSVAVFAESVEIGQAGRLDRDLQMFGEALYFDGYSAADVTAHAKIAVISGTIEGDVELDALEVEIGDGAVINGDLTIIGCDDPVISPDAMILGEVVERPREKNVTLDELSAPYVAIYFYLSLFVIGVLVALISRRHFAVAAGAIIGEAPRSIAFGLLGFGVGLAMFIVLAITLIGIPAALLTLFVLLLFVFVFGQLYSAGAIGAALIQRGTEGSVGLWLLRILIGLAILALVTQAPFIGWLIYLLAGLFGLGGFIIGFLRCRAEKGDGVNALLGGGGATSPPHA
ncbi:MAG TPA: hypothetical protein VLB27_00650, partial [candidate division Zixibacteria bacterium]|nr:hypothetical protein [candidate division Zixibacteria bacterium]